MPVPTFAEEYKKRPLALKTIMESLDGPRPTGSEMTVVNLVTYPADAIREELGFDLKKVAPELTRTSENEAQRTYMLTLNVIAVDTNVEAATPGMAQNKETLVFKLVSDGELLTEIAREEAGLADKLDDAIRRLSDVDNKLRSMVAKFNTLTTPESFIPEQTRANEVNEQLGKSKDVTAEVSTDYSRILLEFRVNRLPEHLIRDMDQKVVSKLARRAAERLPADGRSLRQGARRAGGHPQAGSRGGLRGAEQGDGAAGQAPRHPQRHRPGAGSEEADHRELEDLLSGVATQQALFEYQQEDARKTNLQIIVVRPPTTPVSVMAGQKVTVRVPVKIGQAYNGTFTLQVEPSPGSELKVVDKIMLKEDDEEFVLEITAGFNKGNHLGPDNAGQGAGRGLESGCEVRV